MSRLKTKLRKFIISGTVGATMSLSAIADSNLQPLGNLAAENSVTVVSETGQLPVENSYSYFGGDRIVTGDDGIAGLTLGNDGGVYVGKGSTAAVRKVGDEYVVDLEKGSVGFSFEQGVPFKVMAGGKVIQAASGQAPVSGAVELNSKGEVAVRSLKGDIQTVADSGERATIGFGEIYAMSEGTGRLVKTQEVSEEDDDDRKFAWWWIPVGALGVWAIVEATDTGGGGGGTKVAAGPETKPQPKPKPKPKPKPRPTPKPKPRPTPKPGSPS